LGTRTEENNPHGREMVLAQWDGSRQRFQQREDSDDDHGLDEGMNGTDNRMNGVGYGMNVVDYGMNGMDRNEH
jgi:hypothetical protein